MENKYPEGPQSMVCPYCFNEARWCSNKEIYGKVYGESHMIWLCKPCDAYVGCHQNTRRPKGTMATAELRKARIATHAVLDPVWKSRKWRRKEVYESLSKYFGREIHVGECGIQDCAKVREACHLLFYPL